MLSAIRVVSSAYLRLLIFLPEIWISVCASSSPAFHMMYSAYSFPDSSVGKESACNAGNPSSIPGSGRSTGEGIGTHSSILGLPLWFQPAMWEFYPWVGRYPGEGKDYQFLYSGLENSMDYTVHGVAKSWTQLSDFHFHCAYKLNKQGDNI